jgi:GNAT superfamily N-acetyltransferase
MISRHLPSFSFPIKNVSSFRMLLWDLKLALSAIGIDRVSAVLKREAMIKSNHPKESIACLWFIGVNPQLQGKGVGSAFIQEVIKECEQKKRPIYLETSMEKNLPFYKKFGFEIFQSLQLTYTLYQLRRV